MRATKGGETTYISDYDVYLSGFGDKYDVYNKHTDAYLGKACAEDVPDFMRLRAGLRTWGGKEE